jgi:large subunit ribosomal protein L15
MKLHELSDRPGARKKRQRIGRGIGSGMGKTGGRGGKGQTARSGVRIKGFEGGQMPLHRRLPKRGFNNISARQYNEVGLDRIQQALDSGRLEKGATVNAAALKAAGVIRRTRDGVRILANGELKAKLAFEVAGASAAARTAVEKAGGSITIVAARARAAQAEAKTAE